MSAGIANILPSIVSGSGFAGRRLKRGAEAENAAQSAMNFGVATGQIERAAECSANAAKISKGNLAEMVCKIDKDIAEASKTGTFLKGFGKAAQFVGDNVNPIICVTSGVKIATSKDPVRESVIEVPGVVLMLYGTEPLWKNIAGMADHKRGKDGNLVTKERIAIYKRNPFIKKQVEALKEVCETKKFFGVTLKQACENNKFLKVTSKHLPPAAKGVGLIAFSAGGYALGTAGGRLVADAAMPIAS